MAELQVERKGNSYILSVDGQKAGHADFTVKDGTRVFDHTVIEQSFRGQGLSKPLIKAALEQTLADQVPFTATCSAVVKFIEENPEFRPS